MNGTLESMARALFKSWFVDFDPVIDNALAAGNPIPEPLIQRAQTRRDLGTKRKPLPKNIQKLFPDAFVFDEDMGWVPEGWTVQPLSGIADVVMGTSPKSSTYNDVGEGTPLVNGPVEFGDRLSAQPGGGGEHVVLLHGFRNFRVDRRYVGRVAAGEVACVGGFKPT